MVGAFPVFKLGALAIKQIGKPLANYLKRKAKTNTFFRNYVCLPPAQLYHLWETRLKLKLLGLEKPKEIMKLSEDSAVDLGAEVLGEIIIFVVGATCLLLEYRRQVRKENHKENCIQNTLDQLTSQLNELMTIVEIQDAKVRELTKAVATSSPEHSH
ncbi:putative OPA3-like protein [Schistosoma japonicum]|uniref:Putative OPA3-like protein n=1 Tax=Schistosoma japonicum TaxID=6182 RepID=A0A4Z2D7W5_SCHJA|nr:Optic atrophy 3 protein like [Schistosoma japonicum]KAH8859644.1 Optic atrophy 3 protein like [Schistosoma japonicum]TNN12577.1 putative OPA3-like protein [Schistosoma japonicum]